MKSSVVVRVTMAILCVALFSSCSSSKSSVLEKRLQELSETADFGAVEYTVKKVIKVNDVGEWYKIGDRKILFSTTAYLKAGIDMSGISMDNVAFEGNKESVTLTLPRAKLLSINMPADETVLVYDQISFFRSSFSAEERNALLKQGEADIAADIYNMGILDDAEENVADFFSAMLYQMGFKNVTVNFISEEVEK